MIHEKALALAGPGALLVARPAGVAHVYTGPLTPSGRYAAAAGQTVCRARTRRLTVLPERPSSLAPRETGSPRLCARCSARLASCKGVNARRAEPPCIHRSHYRRRYAALTLRDLWAQAVMAETLDELEAVAHLSLVLHGHAACDRPMPVSHEGYHAASFTELLGNLRERLAGYPNAHLGEEFRALVESSYAQAKAERHAAWQEREAAIRHLGFVNATT